MRKQIQLYVLLLWCTGLNAQWINIDGGGFYTYGNTTITLNETSLNNNGVFDAGSTGTLVLQSPANILEIDGNSSVTSYHILIDADCSVNTDLNVNGDITMQSGITDINNYDIILGGDIIDEREESRITSSGSGEIIKTVTLFSGEPVVPGNMGLGFTPGENYNELEIRRGHQPEVKESDEGINRYFSFDNTVLFNEISFHYFDAELNSLNEEELEIWGDKSGIWEQTGTSTKDFSANIFTVAVNDSYGRFSLFSEKLQTELFIPEGFSPNNNGINDMFYINGLDTYDNVSLVVYNRWGSLVYKESNYQNDWNGKAKVNLSLGNDLPAGTYYYVLHIKDIDKKYVGYIYLTR